MSDSAIALGIFGSDKAVLATDVTAGVHTLKVTTNAASDGVVVPGFGAAKYVIGTVMSGGVHTLCATTSAANAAIALIGAGAEKIVLGTVASGGVHTIAVTTGAANSAILVNTFGWGLTKLATVLAAGVHTLAVNTTANGSFAVSSFGADKSVMASALTGNVQSLTVSGLASYVGPLDYRPGAVGIAGTILFYSAYAGKAIRVRNPDTNVESDIAFTSAGVLDDAEIAAAQGASLTLPVVKLYAQDGSGNDYVQATASKQPLLTANGPSSAWCVEFDGVDDAMLAPLVSVSNPIIRYSIFNPIVQAPIKYYADFAAADAHGDLGTFYNDSAPAAKIYVNGSAVGPVDFPAATWSIATNLFNLTASALRRNKLAAVTGTLNASTSVVGSVLGGKGSGISDYTNTAFVGVAIFPAADNTTAQNLVIDALGAAAGISV